MEKSLDPAIPKGLGASNSEEGVQERSWVVASQKGDSLAFNRLVLKWEKAIYNLALRMLQDPDEAAETAQDVFLCAFRSIDRFRQDSKFSTWLYRIAVNQCITRVRRRPPGVHLSLDTAAEDTPLSERLSSGYSQEGEFLQGECRRKVRSALSFLPAEQRAVVELKFFQDLTFEEISAVTRAPLSTVKSRLYSGLEILKLRLGGIALQGSGR